MKEILILIAGSNVDQELDACSKEFAQKANIFESLDLTLDSLSLKYNKE